MSAPQVVTILVNGLGVTRFTANTFDLDITDDTVTLTCSVPNTQQAPVIIDDRNTELLDASFTNRAGEKTTLADLSQPRP